MDKPYEVLDQRETIAQLPDRTYGNVVRVTFRTRDDVVLAVDVPSSVYSVDTVRAAIEDKVAHADAIQAL